MSQLSVRPVTLENLGGGVLAEKFDVSWQRVMDNLMDPNTKQSVNREINIKIKIKPSEEREICNLEIECTEKLAPDYGYGTMVFIDKDIKGKHEAFENNPRQPQLPFKEKEDATEPADEETESKNNVRVIGGGKKE